MHKPNATIILIFLVNSKNYSKIGKNALNYFVELVKRNPLIYNTLHFDQYSRLAFPLNIFLFSAINSKTKSFPLVCRARWDESIDVNVKDLG